MAYLNINVPADAKLYLQDQLMTVEGAQRRFVTPLIQAGEQHLYTVKVEVVRDGKTLTKTAQTTVTLGQEAVVTVAFEGQESGSTACQVCQQLSMISRPPAHPGGRGLYLPHLSSRENGGIPSFPQEPRIPIDPRWEIPT